MSAAASDLKASAPDTGSLAAILARQKAAIRQRRVPPTYAERVDALDRLKDKLFQMRMEFAEAISEDFGNRAHQETILLEIFVLIDEIRHTKRHLYKWMKPKSVMPNWQFLPGGAKFIYQPLGVVGVLGAWNYQLLLTLSPLIGALSAGNHVMLKPSELAPITAELMRSMIADLYPEDYVTVITGGVEVAGEFSSLPFDHMIFTGSTRVGRIIMRNASEHLTPVTLELGGKSPALIGENYPIDRAARRIVNGKFSNAGQTCVAPDYVLLPEGKTEEFMEHAREITGKFYPALVKNPDYTTIITERHYERLEKIVQEVRNRGGRVEVVNPASEDCNIGNRVFPPTFVWNCPEDTTVLQEELFGPILPIVTYRTLTEAIDYINDRPRPLALYYFDNERRNIDRVLNETISGGVTLGGCIYHLPQNNLPFGGVGDSGMGAYHGYDGFMNFSKKKAVFIQRQIAATMLLRPPYGWLYALVVGTLLRNYPAVEKFRKRNGGG